MPPGLLCLPSMPDLALLFIAGGLLRFCPPARAHALLARLGSLLPALRTAEEARRAARSLSGHGTCLTRSLAISARAPAAEVVIAVQPRGRGPLFAHAWIEIDGTPINPSDVAGTVIARLRSPRARPRAEAGSNGEHPR